MKKIFITTLLLAIILTFALVSFVGCNKIVEVNYALDNNFDVKIIDSEEYLIFEPTGENGVAYKYGLIFYLGTTIGAEKYSYLGEALAKQGYLAVFYREKFAWAKYKDHEEAFDMYPSVQFFIGGHSQGGGAAVRRTMECKDSVIGAVLFDPLCLPGRHPLLDENGVQVKDENGVGIYVVETLIDVQLPVLLLEAYNDTFWINPTFKQDALNRMNEDYLVYDKIEGDHLGFAHFEENDTDEKIAQREYAKIATLAFMQSVVLDLE